MQLKLLTTIVATRREWSVARFELLAQALQLQSGDGNFLFAVAGCEREPLEADDPVLRTVPSEEFDAMWLAAVGRKAAMRVEERGAALGLHEAPNAWPRRLKVTGAFEASPGKGRFIADCSLEYFADFNPERRVVRASLVGQRAAGALSPEGGDLASAYVYVRNVATWLALLESDERESHVRKPAPHRSDPV